MLCSSLNPCSTDSSLGSQTVMQKYVGFLIVAILATVCFSGCAITPLNNETTNSTVRQFAGFTTNPNETVEIQAAHPGGGWVTLATATTGETALPGFAGVRYYHWFTTVEVPEICWKDCGSLDSYYLYGAEIRILDSTGQKLFSYQEEVSATELLTENPVDLWKAKGNTRDSILIWFETSSRDPF